jgi:hypothetical protein
MDWCDHHAHGRKPISKSARPKITPWERKFFRKFDDPTNFQVICAADHMGISYLLTVCCQFAIESHHERDVVTEANEDLTQALSTIAMEQILVEHALHSWRRLIKSAMQSKQGRAALHAVQNRKRHEIVSQNPSYSP